MIDSLEQGIAPRHFNQVQKVAPKFAFRPVHGAAILATLTAIFLISTMVLLLGALALGMGLWWIPTLIATLLCGAGAVWLTAKYR